MAHPHIVSDHKDTTGKRRPKNEHDNACAYTSYIHYHSPKKTRLSTALWSNMTMIACASCTAFHRYRSLHNHICEVYAELVFVRHIHLTTVHWYLSKLKKYSNAPYISVSESVPTGTRRTYFTGSATPASCKTWGPTNVQRWRSDTTSTTTHHLSYRCYKISKIKTTKMLTTNCTTQASVWNGMGTASLRQYAHNQQHNQTTHKFVLVAKIIANKIHARPQRRRCGAAPRMRSPLALFSRACTAGTVPIWW